MYLFKAGLTWGPVIGDCVRVPCLGAVKFRVPIEARVRIRGGRLSISPWSEGGQGARFRPYEVRISTTHPPGVLGAQFELQVDGARSL